MQCNAKKKFNLTHSVLSVISMAFSALFSRSHISPQHQILCSFAFQERKKFTKIENEHNSSFYGSVYVMCMQILHLGKWKPIFFGREFVCVQTYNYNKFQIIFIGELHWNIAQKFIHSFFPFFSSSCHWKWRKKVIEVLKWVNWTKFNSHWIRPCELNAVMPFFPHLCSLPQH